MNLRRCSSNCYAVGWRVISAPDKWAKRFLRFKDGHESDVRGGTLVLKEAVVELVENLSLDSARTGITPALSSSDIHANSQSVLYTVGRTIARDMGIRWCPKIMSKAPHDSFHLYRLSARERKATVHGIYRCQSLSHFNINALIVLDDFRTSGATLDEIRRAVNENNPKIKVIGLVLGKHSWIRQDASNTHIPSSWNILWQTDAPSHKKTQISDFIKSGEINLDLGQDAEALADYDQALQHNLDTAITYHNREVAQATLSQYRETIINYIRVLKMNPNVVVVYHNRGYARAKLGQYAEAITDYDRALKMNPNVAVAYHNRGYARAKLGQYAEAITDYNRALELNLDIAVTYHNRGVAQAKLDQYAEAITDYNQALAMDPYVAVAYHNRGYARAKLGQYAEAITDYNQALEMDPYIAIAYRNRGYAKAKLGQHAAASADCDQARQLDLHNANAAVLDDDKDIIPFW